jgi:Bacterial self-protective colicin-like immunity
MTGFKDDYTRMMHSFIQGAMPTTEFVHTYLDKFKAETRELDEDEFEILDELFGDVDAYSPDPSLIAENPSFYIDEPQLRERVAMAIKKLT